jgi:hypothetical protein
VSNRDWQRVSQFLGVLLVLLVAAAAAVVLLRPNSTPAGVSPTPTRLASVSPSPSRTPRPTASVASPSDGATPSAEPSPEPTPTPTDAPTPTPKPEITPTPTASPTATPTLEPTAPERSIRFIGLGFDGPTSVAPTARTITFRSEGPGQVLARLYRASEGRVRFCLTRKGGTGTCVESDHGTLIGSTEASGKTVWTVTAIGTAGVAPTADVRLVFRTTDPRLTLEGFRFEGTDRPGYNGIEAELLSEEGDFRIDADWDGPERPWRAQLVDADGGGTVAETEGTGNDLRLESPVGATRLHLSVTNTEALSDQPVFLHAQIRWT